MHAHVLQVQFREIINRRWNSEAHAPNCSRRIAGSTGDASANFLLHLCFDFSLSYCFATAACYRREEETNALPLTHTGTPRVHLNDDHFSGVTGPCRPTLSGQARPFLRHCTRPHLGQCEISFEHAKRFQRLQKLRLFSFGECLLQSCLTVHCLQAHVRL